MLRRSKRDALTDWGKNHFPDRFVGLQYEIPAQVVEKSNTETRPLKQHADPLKTGGGGRGENLARARGPLCRLYSREPVVALVFPKSSRIGVRHRNRLQVFSALESELYRNSQPHRGSPFGGERLLFKIKRQNGLRMQRARHVYTGRIVVKAGEGDVARPQIRADVAQKEVQRHTAPLPDLAPSFDTDVPGDLSLLRQAAQSVDRPRGLF